MRQMYKFLPLKIIEKGNKYYASSNPWNIVTPVKVNVTASHIKGHNIAATCFSQRVVTFPQRVAAIRYGPYGLR